MVQYLTIMTGSGHSSHCLCTVTVMVYVSYAVCESQIIDFVIALP